MADWPFSPPITPMEAEVADELPPPPGWSYEPKWDGFRAVMWSTGGAAGESAAGEAGAPAEQAGGTAGETPRGPRLDSRNGKPLRRYFPELEPALAQLPAGTVADGEVVVIVDGRLDFDALQNRIHPAASRIRRLAEETPRPPGALRPSGLRGARPARASPPGAPQGPRGTGRVPGGLQRRRPPPQRLRPGVPLAPFPQYHRCRPRPAMVPRLRSGRVRRGGRQRRSSGPYAEGRREMIKLKHRRTADCVVGGYRVHKDGRRVGSILLGLYDVRGELHFIGHCSSFTRRGRPKSYFRTLRDLAAAAWTGSGDAATTVGAPSGGPTLPIAPAGFGEHARRPGEPSRWSGGKDLAFIAVPPVLVVEVSYDQLTGDRFRHGTRSRALAPGQSPARLHPRSAGAAQGSRASRGPAGWALRAAGRAAANSRPAPGSNLRESRDGGPPAGELIFLHARRLPLLPHDPGRSPHPGRLRERPVFSFPRPQAALPRTLPRAATAPRRDPRRPASGPGRPLLHRGATHNTGGTSRDGGSKARSWP